MPQADDALPTLLPLRVSELDEGMPGDLGEDEHLQGGREGGREGGRAGRNKGT